MCAAASPVFTEHPLDQTVDKGSRFNVSCSATGYPTPDIVWYKDDSVYGLAHLFDPGSVGRLVFLEAIAEHAGVYQCQATNEHSSLLSEPGTVSVHCECRHTHTHTYTHTHIGRCH